MGVGKGGQGGLGLSWILKFSANNGCFLSFESGKNPISPLWHLLEKFRKNREVASPRKNPFVAHARSVSNVFCHLYLKLLYFFVEPICKNTIFNDRIKENVENADLHLKTNKKVLKILSYKRSPRIKQTWNYKNERLQCWNQQYIPACTLDFEYSNTRSLLTGYKVINWPELFFQLAALSTYGTFPIRRFLSVVHFFLRQVSWNHRGHISHPIC